MDSTMVTLAAGYSHQFNTNEGTYCVLNVTNQSQVSVARFAIACDTGKPEPLNSDEQIPPNGYWSSSVTDFGGGTLLVVNTTNPAKASDIEVTLTKIGPVS